MTEELERLAHVYRGYTESHAADRWSLSNRGNRAALSERNRVVRELLHARGWIPLGKRRVLEVGCGTGSELARLREFGAEPTALVGVDVLADRVTTARERFPDLDFQVSNGVSLDFPDEAFDLVLAITLFSSIQDDNMARHLAAEIARVTAPQGALLWYDFRYDNPRNPNVHGVDEEDVRSLLPRFEGTLRSITLLPPLSRRLGPLTSVMYPALTSIPKLRTHLVGLLDKRRA